MTANPSKILFVDDDPHLLAAFQRTFRKQFAFDTAMGGEEALRLLQSSGPYAVVLADMSMPGMNGVEVLERVRALSPDTVRMMLTGNADQRTAVESVNRAGVFRFLNKPCPGEELAVALTSALEQHKLVQLERELLEGTVAGSIKLLTDVLGVVSPEALGRGQRLRRSMTRFARHVGASPEWEFEVSALLSSIGFAVVPPQVLARAAAGADLNENEAAVLRRAPQTGHDLLADIPRLAGVARNILYQHKNFDGSGFPADDCAGEAIPLGGRLLRILGDRIELETDGVVKQRALETMQARSGAYDPKLLVECFVCFPTFLANALSAGADVLSLRVSQLEPGLIVVSDISTQNGLVLVGAGYQLTATIVQRIRNFADIGEVREPVLVQRPASDEALTLNSRAA